MTKKHFQLIAQIVSEIEDVVERAKIAVRFSDELKALNPRFDVIRFLDSCGL